MTAIPLTLQREPAAPVDLSAFVSIDEAARRIGCDAGHLRRQCPKLLAEGLAWKGKAPGDGRDRWWIHRGYQPDRLDAEQAVATPGTADPQAVSIATQRAACVRQLWRARQDERAFPGPQKQWLPRLVAQLRREFPSLRISERGLRRWASQYRSEADLSKLIDKPKGGNTRGEPDPAAWQYFCELFLTERRPTRKWCWKQTRHAAHAQGWTWCSYPALIRLVRTKLPPATRAYHRKPGEYRERFTSYIKMDPNTWGPGECWIGDHCVLDLWCLYGGKLIRPWLTAWQDWHTRKIVGWTLSPKPSSETIRAAFAAAMRDTENRGGPDVVYIDNGKDYACYAFHGATKQQRRDKVKLLGKGYIDEGQFRGLFGELSIDVIFAKPFNARAKGRLEKWFHYGLHEDFDKAWETYAGNKPEARPEALAAILKGDVPTFEQVHEAIGPHIEGFNTNADHSLEGIEGMSPAEAYAQARRRQFADPGVLEHLLLTYSEPVRVHRNGVTIRPLGKAIQYGGREQRLVPFKGTDKLVRVGYHQNDLRRAWVFDDRMRLIAEVQANDPGLAVTDAVGREQLGDAIADQRRVDKAAKLVARKGHIRLQSTQTLAAMNARRKQQPTPQAPDPGGPVRLVQTALDGQAKRIHTEPYRQAAGAETTPPLMSLQERMAKLPTRPSASHRGRPSAVKPMPSLSTLTKGGGHV